MKNKIIIWSLLLASCTNNVSTELISENTTSELIKPYSLPEKTNLNRKIIYLTDSPNSDNNISTKIFSIDPDGNNKEKILDISKEPMYLTDLLINSEGSKIFYTINENSKISLIQSDISGAKSKVIAKDIDPKSLNLSRDQKKLKYLKINPETGLSIINVYDIEALSVSELKVKAKSLKISPDNKKILFIENEQLKVANYDGSEVKNIGKSQYIYRGFSWSPDNSKIYFSYAPFNLSVVNSDGSNEQLLIKDINSFDLYEDGTKIVYISSSDNKVKVYNLQTRKVTTLPYENLPDSLEEAKWSPDGKKIAILIKKDITIINEDGTNPKKITNEFFMKESLPNVAEIRRIYGVSRFDW